MDNIEELSLKCRYCKKLIDSPVILICCQYTICEAHVNDLLEKSGSSVCLMCEKQYDTIKEKYIPNRIIERVLKEIESTKLKIKSVESKIDSFPNLLNTCLNENLLLLDFRIEMNNDLLLNRFKSHLDLKKHELLNEARSIGEAFIKNNIYKPENNSLFEKWYKTLNEAHWIGKKEFDEINEKLTKISKNFDEFFQKTFSTMDFSFEPNTNIDFESTVKIGRFSVQFQISELKKVQSSSSESTTSNLDMNNNNVISSQLVRDTLNYIMESDNKSNTINSENSFNYRRCSNVLFDRRLLEELNKNDNEVAKHGFQLLAESIDSNLNIQHNFLPSTPPAKETRSKSNSFHSILSNTTNRSSTSSLINIQSACENVVRLKGHTKKIECSMFDRTCKYFITASEDCLIKIWSLDNNLLMATLKGHDKSINCIDVDPTNTLLASGSKDKRIIIWDLNSTRILDVVQLSANCYVESIKFSPLCVGDKRYLVSGGSKFYIWSWNVNSVNAHLKSEAKFKENSNKSTKIYEIDFNKGGTLAGCLVSDGSLCIYDMINFDKIADLEFGLPRINKFKFNDVSIDSNQIRIFTAIVNKSENKSIPLSINWPAYNEWTATVMDNKTLENYNEKDDKSPVKFLDINSENRLLITGQLDYTIKIYDVFSLSLIDNFKIKETNIQLQIMSCHPTLSDIMLTYGNDNRVIIWNIKNGIRQKKNISFDGIGSNLDQINWSPVSDQFLFCATNSFGEHFIYRENPTPISSKTICYEQFFEKDFHTVDKKKFIDPKTNKNIDLTPNGKLVNSNGVAYDAEIQSYIRNMRHSPADNESLNDGLSSNSLSIISQLDKHVIEQRQAIVREKADREGGLIRCIISKRKQNTLSPLENLTYDDYGRSKRIKAQDANQKKPIKLVKNSIL